MVTFSILVKFLSDENLQCMCVCVCICMQSLITRMFVLIYTYT